jgi:hypothetical protein
MNNNLKGLIGETEVTLELIKNGWDVFRPISDYSAVDLVALKGATTIRLQVKFRAKDSRGLFEISFSSVVNGKKVPIDKSLIDYVVVVSDDLPYNVYIPIVLVSDRKVVSFRESTLEERQELWKVNQVGT